MSDHLVRIITKSGNFRALACVTTDLVKEACRRHNTFPTASAALGRALTGGVLLGALLKTGQRVALKFEGNGPLKKIVVEADSNGAVHGYVGVLYVYMVRGDGKLDVAGALGKAGFLTVTKDLGLKEPSTRVWFSFIQARLQRTLRTILPSRNRPLLPSPSESMWSQIRPSLLRAGF